MCFGSDTVELSEAVVAEEISPPSAWPPARVFQAENLTYVISVNGTVVSFDNSTEQVHINGVTDEEDLLGLGYKELTVRELADPLDILDDDDDEEDGEDEEDEFAHGDKVNITGCGSVRGAGRIVGKGEVSSDGIAVKTFYLVHLDHYAANGPLQVNIAAIHPDYLVKQ